MLGSYSEGGAIKQAQQLGYHYAGAATRSSLIPA